MNEPLVTVIVPVYNVERWLEQCLESVASQTYTHLEIIVVDDGSTDGSATLCDQWAERDSRIKVIHKPNGGLSDARNAALDVAQGEFITFVDSDDFVDVRCVELLLNALNDNPNCDIAVGHWQEFDDGTEPTPKQTDAKTRVFTPQEAALDIFYQKSLTHSAWGRMFRRHFFDGEHAVRFPVGMLYEDLAVIMPLLDQASGVVFIPDVIYFYRKRQSSIIGTFNKRRTHVLNILDDLQHKAPHQFPWLERAIKSRRLSACFNILLLCPRKNDVYNDVTARCWQGIKELRHGCLFDSHVRTKNKVAIVLSWLGKKAFVTLFAHNKE